MEPRTVRVTLEMELVEGRDFPVSNNVPEEFEVDALLFAAEAEFSKIVADHDFEFWEYVQSKVVEEPT